MEFLLVVPAAFLAFGAWGMVNSWSAKRQGRPPARAARLWLRSVLISFSALSAVLGGLTLLHGGGQGAWAASAAGAITFAVLARLQIRREDRIEQAPGRP
jgi:hypothetical protein